MTAPWPAGPAAAGAADAAPEAPGAPEPPAPARRSGGMLSLRARLLVLLICVTAVFLLVMGAVSTIVLSRRLGGEFNAQLVAAAQHSPQQIASNPGDYVAVEITSFPVQDPLADRQLRRGQGAGRHGAEPGHQAHRPRLRDRPAV